MAIDTPATVAVIGAGPLGLEAALYARYLGYHVRVFERGEVASGLMSRGAMEPEAPFSDRASKLGLAALHAQNPQWRPPSPSARLAAAAWRDCYLEPLAKSDLLVDAVTLHCEVLGVRLTTAGEDDREPSGDVAGSADSRSTDNTSSIEPQVVDRAGIVDQDSPEAAIWLEPDEPLEPNFELTYRSARAARPEETFAAHVVIDASGHASSLSVGRPVALSTSAGEDVRRRARRTYAGASLTTRAPHYFFLGAASGAEDDANLTFQQGLAQIRALFAIVGGRESLDLYATMDKLLP